MNSRDTFLAWKSSIAASETALSKSKPKIQSTHNSANALKSNRNKLTARWVMENGKLVCHWIKGE